MGLFNFGKAKGEAPQDLAERAAAAEAEVARKEAQVEELKELVRHLDEDRLLLFMALEQTKPGMDAKALGQVLLDLTFKPLALASFYLALVDWEEDVISFPVFHEGGRLRNQPPTRGFRAKGGLTGKAIFSNAPLYIRTLEEAQEAGAIFSEAERISGLVPQSWYGIPLGPPPHFGLLSFLSFHPDAFPESRRRLMDGLAAILARTLMAKRP